MNVPQSPELNALEALHARVDLAVQGLEAKHGAGITCHQGCHHCCQDDLAVGRAEAALIAQHASELLATERPHPVGRCAFLDREGSCRIYAVRPYRCRSQGVPLAWFEEDPEDEDDVMERRGLCERNAPIRPLDDLADDELWLIGPVELELQALDAQLARAEGVGSAAPKTGASEERVALRQMFRHPPSPGWEV